VLEVVVFVLCGVGGCYFCVVVVLLVVCVGGHFCLCLSGYIVCGVGGHFCGVGGCGVDGCSVGGRGTSTKMTHQYHKRLPRGSGACWCWLSFLFVLWWLLFVVLVCGQFCCAGGCGVGVGGRHRSTKTITNTTNNYHVVVVFVVVGGCPFCVVMVLVVVCVGGCAFCVVVVLVVVCVGGRFCLCLGGYCLWCWWSFLWY